MSALSLEELAVVLAHVTYFPPADTARVLAKLGVSMQAFLDAVTAHPIAIADGLSAGNSGAADRFQSKYEHTTKVLAQTKPDIDELAARPAGAAAASPADPSLDETIDGGAAPAGSMLPPFQPGPPMKLAASSPRTPGDAGDTAGLDAPPGDALPFQQPDFSHWAVETHASFTAERRFLDPDAVRERYGLRDGADEYALMVHFNRRFAREPGLRDRWVELVQRRARDLERGG